MLTNADITLYHACADPEQKRKIYRRTVIHGVHWFTNQRTTVNDGLKSADEYRIRIPQEACAGYLPPYQYRSSPEGHWTIENGDLFVRGVCELDIEKASDLALLHPGKVLSWSDNRRGVTPHIRIGGA